MDCLICGDCHWAKENRLIMKKKPKEKLELEELPLEQKGLLPVVREVESQLVPMQKGWFKYLVPREKREEMIGDLIETRYEMEKEGHAQWVIDLVMLAHKGLILLYLLRGRIGDYGKKRRKVDRNK